MTSRAKQAEAEIAQLRRLPGGAERAAIDLEDKRKVYAKVAAAYAADHRPMHAARCLGAADAYEDAAKLLHQCVSAQHEPASDARCPECDRSSEVLDTEGVRWPCYACTPEDRLAGEAAAPTLGAVVHGQRIAAGLTLRQLARRCGMTPTELGEVERGISTPAPVAMLKIFSGIVLGRMTPPESES